jgi:DNA-binding transcriptional regulator YiaG
MFIAEKFKGEKIAIFYKFVEEYNALKLILKSSVTNDLNEFNTTDKSIALQIVSGREGISLAKAKYLIYYNIDFSAISYWQSRDRLTTMDRKSNDVYWIFSEGGIESKIYASVQKKKDYTNDLFKRDYARKQNTSQNNSAVTKRGMALRKTY